MKKNVEGYHQLGDQSGARDQARTGDSAELGEDTNGERREDEILRPIERAVET